LELRSISGFLLSPGPSSIDGMEPFDHLMSGLTGCRLCADAFRATASAHEPRPVAWFAPQARVLICGQAPGLRVHGSGRPFDDASGQRLRGWLGMDDNTFWDRTRVAFLPMAFCFPGYDAAGADLPPPKICAATWRRRVLQQLPEVRLTFLIGLYAQRWHLGPARTRGGLSATVTGWRAIGPDVFPLPHPSWRNSGWLKRSPWFEAELLPQARARVSEVLTDA
jgi:uracil-DNA glycosylase